MEYFAFVLGLMGMMAFLEISPLKRRIDELERALAKMKGTTYHEDRTSLRRAAGNYIGKSVHIDLREDHADADIMSYGNSRHGSNVILDVDEDWLLIRIQSPKGTKEKLIRMESIERISVEGEENQ